MTDTTARKLLARTALVAAVSLGALTGCNSDDGDQTASEPTADSSTTAPSTPTSSAPPESPSSPQESSTPDSEGLTSEGYGKLKLLMTPKQIKQTGEATVGEWQIGGESMGCAPLDIKSQPAREGLDDGIVSPDQGLVEISVPEGLSTPEGIHIGSTEAEVKAAYPDAKPWLEGFAAKTDRPDTAWTYTVSDGVVDWLALTRTDAVCFEIAS